MMCPECGADLDKVGVNVDLGSIYAKSVYGDTVFADLDQIRLDAVFCNKCGEQIDVDMYIEISS